MEKYFMAALITSALTLTVNDLIRWTVAGKYPRLVVSE